MHTHTHTRSTIISLQTWDSRSVDDTFPLKGPPHQPVCSVEHPLYGKSISWHDWLREDYDISGGSKSWKMSFWNFTEKTTNIQSHHLDGFQQLARFMSHLPWCWILGVSSWKATENVKHPLSQFRWEPPLHSHWKELSGLLSQESVISALPSPAGSRKAAGVRGSIPWPSTY